MIVVKEHGRFRLPLQLGERRGREGVVHLRVAPAPGLVKAPVDVGRFPQAVQVVMDEPEDGVGDHVVVPVVGPRLVRDQSQAERRPVGRLLVERLSAGLARDDPVLLAQSARDPGHVVAPDETP